VRAATVNIGGQSGPDYRLTLQSTSFAADTIQLKDADGHNMLDQLSGGSAVTYKINGGAEITNNTRTIQLASGLTVNLLSQSAPGAATTIDVSRGTDAIQSALSAFALAYNNTMTELDLHRGSGTGALKGDSVVSSVSNALRQIASYSESSGDISSLASLGLSFDKTGKLSLDATTFNLNTSGRLNDLASFLGSATGGGFLQVATDTVNSFEDPQSGILQLGKASLSTEMTRQDARIAAEQERVDQLSEQLRVRMAAADALIASMEQQVTFYNGMFESMRVNSAGL
jgi:flagellar hook-associated protein 2